MIQLLLGEDYTILPRFTFSNPEEINKAYTGSAQLLSFATTERNNQLVMDEWLHGVSVVRPKMHLFETMHVMHDMASANPLTCTPMQLPYKENDTWLAVEYPEDTEIDHDTLSFAQYTPQGFDPAQLQAGILIDDWVEVVPQREEVTGITYNFNQPNSVPPQSILLAVSPQEQGPWTWDNLVDSIRDTFHRAKLRAVEPDQLDTSISILNKFLPGVISEFSTSKNNISLDMAMIFPVLAVQIATLASTEEN